MTGLVDAHGDLLPNEQDTVLIKSALDAALDCAKQHAETCLGSEQGYAQQSSSAFGLAVVVVVPEGRPEVIAFLDQMIRLALQSAFPAAETPPESQGSA